MEVFIVLFVGLVCLAIVYRFKKSLYNAPGIYVLMWTCCLGLSTLGLAGLNRPSSIVVSLGCFSMIIFTFTGLLNTRLITIRGKTAYKNRVNEYEPLTNNLTLYLLNIIAYMFSFPYLLKALELIQSVGMYGLRDVAFASSEYASTNVLIIFQTLIGPLFVVTMLLTAIDLSRKFFVKKALIITIFDVVLYTVLFGGRYMLFQLLIFFLFSMYDGYGEQLKRFINNHKKLIVFVLIIVLIMTIITEFRTSRGFFESIYIYFCGSFSYLSYLIENQIGTNLYLFGKTQMGFIYNFCYLIISFLTNINYEGSNQIITQLTQSTVKIGDGISYNSLGTILHDFIADYGIYGSLIGIFIFGYACRYIENAKNKTGRSIYYALNIYLLYSTINSVLGYTFRGPGALMIILYIFLFCRRKK